MESIRKRVGQTDFFYPSVSEEYLRDESRFTGTASGIAFPRCEAEVEKALQIASADQIPVTIQGGRTGISGGAVPRGGYILNLERMNKIGQLHASTLTVEPGARLTEIRNRLAGSGFMFTPDPTEATASIGGMAACNASGANSFQYGSIRNHISAMTIILPCAETLRLRRGENRADGLTFCLRTEKGHFLRGKLPSYAMPNTKNAAGYFAAPDMDLLDLFIGSEGTLGIVTALDLILAKASHEICGVMAFFQREADALNYAETLRKQGPHKVKPTAIEYLDKRALELLREEGMRVKMHSWLRPLAAHWNTAIYIEFCGCCKSEIMEKLNHAGIFIQESGGSKKDTWVALNAHTLKEFALLRHTVPEIVNQIIAERKKTVPTIAKLASDMAVPAERLSGVLAMYQADLHSAGLEWASWGHIGNSHVHVNILPRDEIEYTKGQELITRWAKLLTKQYGGTVTAEHGVGKLKKSHLEIMYGPEGIGQMMALKQVFDPYLLLNRGNVFD